MLIQLPDLAFVNRKLPDSAIFRGFLWKVLQIDIVQDKPCPLPVFALLSILFSMPLTGVR
ncbi:MAG: hypothetical protein DME42_03230 [Verrucomicrobia bacterium]|nr:MAG: hypothetical protein DME42_03230 [Verrucomicrobiota bacterium]